MSDGVIYGHRYKMLDKWVQFIVYRNESLCNNMQEAIEQVRFAIGIA
jgi:hypothetical protein